MFWNRSPLLLLLRTAAFAVVLSHFFQLTAWLSAAIALGLALGLNWWENRANGE